MAAALGITGHFSDLLHLGEAVRRPDHLANVVDNERLVRAEAGEAAVRVRRRLRNPRWDRRRASGGSHGRSDRDREPPGRLSGRHHAVCRARDLSVSGNGDRDDASRSGSGERSPTRSFSRSDRQRGAASAGHLRHPDAHDRRLDRGRLVDQQGRRTVCSTGRCKIASYGRFFALLNGASFLVQVALTSYVLKRFGIGIALLLLPLGLLTGAVGLLVHPSLWMAALAKGTDGTLRYSLDQSTRELLILPGAPRREGSREVVHRRGRSAWWHWRGRCPAPAGDERGGGALPVHCRQLARHRGLPQRVGARACFDERQIG